MFIGKNYKDYKSLGIKSKMYSVVSTTVNNY